MAEDEGVMDRESATETRSEAAMVLRPLGPVDYVLAALPPLVCVVMFLAGGVPGRRRARSRVELLEQGANAWEVTTNGEWWRLIASNFVHAQFMVMAVPALVMVVLALVVQSGFGRRLYLVLLLGGMLSGSLTALWISRGSFNAGAGGMALALAGAILGQQLRRLAAGERLSFLWLGGYVTLGGFCVLPIVVPVGHVNNTAQLASLVVGFILGLLLAPPSDPDRARVWKLPAVVAGLIMITAGSWISIAMLPRSTVDLGARYRFMVARIALGNDGLHVWRYVADTLSLVNRGINTGTQGADELLGTAVPAWKKAFEGVMAVQLGAGDFEFRGEQEELAKLRQAGLELLERRAVVMQRLARMPRDPNDPLGKLQYDLVADGLRAFDTDITLPLAAMNTKDDPSQQPRVGSRRSW